LIEIEDLVKRFGDLTAVGGVSVVARGGEITGLLGPNGAGKSTTIGCVSGLLQPSSGSVRVLGHDVVRNGKAARAALGVVPQELALYEDLTAAENLAYWGGVQGMRGGALAGRVGEVLERIGLADRAKEPVKRFSGGMQRRLNFGCGVVHRPKVLLLDEPTAGVDPQSRVRLLDLVREEAKAGTTVLYTTHYMEEAESLCQRLAIIDHGLLVAQGTLEELRALMGERDLLRLSGRFAPDALRGMLATHPALAGAELVQCDEKELVLALGDASRRLPAIFAALEAAGATVSETTLSRPSLESLFIKLTGKELRE
jgi:ABC-2 type transport system ATP-binding protein